MQTILEYFRVKKTIRYHGTIENLESILDAMESKRLEKEEFYVNKMDKYQYKLNPTVSLGTVQTSVNGILVHSGRDMLRLVLGVLSGDIIRILYHRSCFEVWFILNWCLLTCHACIAAVEVINH